MTRSAGAAMTFLWPALLVLLAALPALVIARLWALRRRRTGLRFSSLSLVRVAIPRSSRIRRHLPFALFLIGLGSLVIAMARPAAIVPVPDGRSTVVLAMDVSRSMCATDIPPNRLVAAEKAAASFVQRQGGPRRSVSSPSPVSPRSSSRRRTTRRSCSTSSRRWRPDGGRRSAARSSN